MARTFFLKKLLTPAGLLFPKDVDSMLSLFEKYISVLTQFTNGSAIEVVKSDTPPTDTTVLWISLDGSGQATGSFSFFGGKWLSTQFKKGEDIKIFLGSIGSLHPHWRLCDPAISGATVNTVTIPDMKNRMLVGATSGGQYGIGDTGGADSVTIAHTHSTPSGNTQGHALTQGQLPIINDLGKTFKGAGPSFPDVESGPGGGLWQTISPLGNNETHSHAFNAATTGSASPSVDVRSQYYAVGYAIYVGIQ